MSDRECRLTLFKLKLNRFHVFLNNFAFNHILVWILKCSGMSYTGDIKHPNVISIVFWIISFSSLRNIWFSWISSDSWVHNTISKINFVRKLSNNLFYQHLQSLQIDRTPSSDNTLHINTQALGSFRGGSLPNVSAGSTSEKTNTHTSRANKVTLFTKSLSWFASFWIISRPIVK